MVAMKLLTISTVFVLGALAQQTSAQKPAPAPAATTKPAVTPLTDTEKLQIRELQLKINNLQRQKDVEIPKLLSDTQEEINKLVLNLQVQHNAQAAALKYDLTWEVPPAPPEKQK